MVPVMSFWPKIFKRITDQKKLLEYRRVFPKDCSYAYMYISKPVKAICAIVYFGKKHSLDDWRQEYKNNTEVMERIDNYSDSYKYAMEIESVQLIEPISLDELRENVPSFTAPQSYVLLENNKELESYIKSNTKKKGDLIVNDLSTLLPDNICLRYD